MRLHLAPGRARTLHSALVKRTLAWRRANTLSASRAESGMGLRALARWAGMPPPNPAPSPPSPRSRRSFEVDASRTSAAQGSPTHGRRARRAPPSHAAPSSTPRGSSSSAMCTRDPATGYRGCASSHLVRAIVVSCGSRPESHGHAARRGVPGSSQDSTSNSQGLDVSVQQVNRRELGATRWRRTPRLVRRERFRLCVKQKVALENRRP